MADKKPIKAIYDETGSPIDSIALGEFTATDTIGIVDGGTGAADATTARSNLGLEIGVDVQAAGSYLTDIVTDLTPQLGGDLDLNGHQIVTSGVDLDLAPGTNDVNLYGANAAYLKIWAGITTGDAGIYIYDGDTANRINMVYDDSQNESRLNFIAGAAAINSTSDLAIASSGGAVSIEGIEYPSTDGTTGQVMYTNGSGVLGFKTLTESDISDLGSYLTGITGESIGDLSDVDLTGSPSPASGDILEFDGSNWVHVTPSELPVALNDQTGTTYGPVLADANSMITLTNASAITVTIPANSSVAYPVGTKLSFYQGGAGQVTIGITTDTLNYASTFTNKLTEQHSVATAVKLTSTSWVLFGDLEAA